MTGAAFTLGIIGATLASFSLGWQVLNYLLTGGRVKVCLVIGALHPHGGLLTLTDPGIFSPVARLAKLAEFADKGYVVPVIGVLAINRGRMLVQITRLEFDTTAKINITPRTLAAPPTLPFDLPAGKSETLLTDLAELTRSVDAAAATFGLERGQITAVGKVTLGTRKRRRTRRIRV